MALNKYARVTCRHIKHDECKLAISYMNTDCLFAAPKNGLDLEGDNKQRDNSEEVQLLGITRQR